MLAEMCGNVLQCQKTRDGYYPGDEVMRKMVEFVNCGEVVRRDDGAAAGESQERDV
jgi:hypothetical protein